MADEIKIETANSTWPELFKTEESQLLAALSSHFVAIEHIGSTAIPHLDAKPIIDMLGGVRSMEEAYALLEPLCQLGWDTSPEFNATLPDRRFLLRWPEGIRTHHLHLVVYGGEQWQAGQTHEKLVYRRCERETGRMLFFEIFQKFLTLVYQVTPSSIFYWMFCVLLCARY